MEDKNILKPASRIASWFITISADWREKVHAEQAIKLVWHKDYVSSIIKFKVWTSHDFSALPSAAASKEQHRQN